MWQTEKTIINAGLAIFKALSKVSISFFYIVMEFLFYIVMEFKIATEYVEQEIVSLKFSEEPASFFKKDYPESASSF
jgi:hypothetical protein